jgi:hypothetical protein
VHRSGAQASDCGGGQVSACRVSGDVLVVAHRVPPAVSKFPCSSNSAGCWERLAGR